MDRLLELETAVAVAEHGGFAAAGREIGQSAPSVTRHIADLEQRLGSPIFIRTTRRVSLTESGTRFIEEARGVVAAYRNAIADVAAEAAEPTGILSVTAPVLFGQKYVAPVLSDLSAIYPTLRIDALFLDRIVDLMEEGIDLAVRIGDLPDSALRARRVGSVRRVVFASDAYLETHGSPTDPKDLLNHLIVAPSSAAEGTSWRFRIDGRDRAIRLNPRMRFNSNAAVLETVSRGQGIGALLSYQVADALRAGTVREILSDFATPVLPVHLVHRGGRMVPARTRVAMDALAGALRREKGLQV